MGHKNQWNSLLHLDSGLGYTGVALVKFQCVGTSLVV